MQADGPDQDWIEPVLNKDYAEWAEHNRTVIMPEKVRNHLSILHEILTPEFEAKQNKKLTNRLIMAHLKGCPEEIANCVNSEHREYLPNGITDTFRSLDFVENGLNICILGLSDSGKTYLAKSLGILACTR